jgi:hypothetical protein
MDEGLDDFEDTDEDTYISENGSSSGEEDKP